MQNLQQEIAERYGGMAMGTRQVEIAYYTPGKGWKRRTFKSEAEAERFVAELDEDVEVRWAS